MRDSDLVGVYRDALQRIAVMCEAAAEMHRRTNNWSTTVHVDAGSIAREALAHTGGDEEARIFGWCHTHDQEQTECERNAVYALGYRGQCDYHEHYLGAEVPAMTLAQQAAADEVERRRREQDA